MQSKAVKCWHSASRSVCLGNKYSSLLLMEPRGKNVRNLIYPYITGKGNPTKIETPWINRAGEHFQHSHNKRDYKPSPMVSATTNTKIIVTKTRPDNCSINIYSIKENEGKQTSIAMVSRSGMVFICALPIEGRKPLLAIHINTPQIMQDF